MKIRLMSFNTQHCLNFKTRKIDFPLMANTIRELGGEIIGLQEMRGAGPREGYTNQTAALAALTGYHAYFAKALDVGGENPYGNAILSKYPILSAKTVGIPDPIPAPKGCETRCVLKAVIDVGAPLTVLVTHFGLSPEEQTQAAKTVLELIEDERCVLMGDFNLTPDDPHLQDIRKKLFDTEALLTGEKLSFPSDAPCKKIDYLLTSPELRVLSAEIPPVVASDHRPYLCDIAMD